MARWKVSVASVVPGVGVGVGVLVDVGVGVDVLVGVGVGVSVLVGVGVGVDELDPLRAFATKEMTVAVPLCVRKRMPQKPEVKALSLAVAIQPLGSEPEAAQTLAVRVDPTTRKWMV